MFLLSSFISNSMVNYNLMDLLSFVSLMVFGHCTTAQVRGILGSMIGEGLQNAIMPFWAKFDETGLITSVVSIVALEEAGRTWETLTPPHRTSSFCPEQISFSGATAVIVDCTPAHKYRYLRAIGEDGRNTKPSERVPRPRDGYSVCAGVLTAQTRNTNVDRE